MSVKNRFDKFNKFIQNYWSDPVWSKVISAIIIGVSSLILTSIYVFIKSIYEKVAFKSVALDVINYFIEKTEVYNFIYWISIIVILCWFTVFLQKIIKKFSKNNVNLENDIEQLPRLGEISTVVFSQPLASAFPGQRGLKWYDSKTAVKRLSIVFKEPLIYESINGSDAVGDPFWWFRAGRSMFINQFKTLSKTKILLGIDELEINRIAVNISQFYYKCFIYVETKSEKQIGLYNFSIDDIEDKKKTFGYCSEEYALLGNKAITREHFDDGATIVKDNVIDTFGAKLRIRYLTNYNFVIAAKQSPYNSHKFDKESYEFFNAILKGEKTAEEFVSILENYERKYY